MRVIESVLLLVVLMRVHARQRDGGDIKSRWAALNRSLRWRPHVTDAVNYIVGVFL